MLGLGDLLSCQNLLFLINDKNLAIFTAKPHNSNSVMEKNLAASGSVLLVYAISFGFPFCIWY